jgi:hypothetical protein
MNLYLRLLGYIRPYRISFVIALAAMSIVSIGKHLMNLYLRLLGYIRPPHSYHNWGTSHL